MRKLNKNDYIVLNNILLLDNVSRIELSELLNITAPGVYKIIKKLQKRNLISDESSSIEKNSCGRPRNSLYINKYHKKIIGVYISVSYLKISISYLDGEIIEVITRKRFNNNIQRQKLIRIMTEEISSTLDKYGKDNIAGIGFVVQGVVDSVNGVIQTSPLFYGKNIKIIEYIEDTFKLPCVVDNSVRAMLLAKKIFDKSFENALLIYINDFIGASLMLNGDIYTGTNFYASQIENSIIDDRKLHEIYSPNFISDRLESSEIVSFDDIIDNINKKKKKYILAINTLSQEMSKSIVNYINMLDVGKVFLAGENIEKCPFFYKSIIDNTKKQLDEQLANNTEFISLEIDNIESLAPIALVMVNLFDNKKLIV